MECWWNNDELYGQSQCHFIIHKCGQGIVKWVGGISQRQYIDTGYGSMGRKFSALERSEVSVRKHVLHCIYILWGFIFATDNNSQNSVEYNLNTSKAHCLIFAALKTVFY